MMIPGCVLQLIPGPGDGVGDGVAGGVGVGVTTGDGDGEGPPAGVPATSNAMSWIRSGAVAAGCPPSIASAHVLVELFNCLALSVGALRARWIVFAGEK
jgi:hypothetical protein